MVVHDEHRCAEGVPFQLAFRRALTEAKDADGVARVLEKTRITVANNLSVVDRAGNARVLELAQDGVVVRAGERLVSTNHFNSTARREPRVTLTYFSSLRRYDVVKGCCDDSGDEVPLEAAQAALKKAAMPLINVQSMVFRPKEGEVYVARGRPPVASGQWVRLQASDLLGN
jgi:hypothetical protein